MALSTTAFLIGPQDGWVLVSASPNFIQIRNRTSRPWQLAVVAAAATPSANNPALTFTPAQDDGHFFDKHTASAGDFFVRVLEDGPSGEKAEFGILADA